MPLRGRATFFLRVNESEDVFFRDASTKAAALYLRKFDVVLAGNFADQR